MTRRQVDSSARSCDLGCNTHLPQPTDDLHTLLAHSRIAYTRVSVRLSTTVAVGHKRVQHEFLNTTGRRTWKECTCTGCFPGLHAILVSCLVRFVGVPFLASPPHHLVGSILLGSPGFPGFLVPAFVLLVLVFVPLFLV
jgi:hypothetical protein